MRMIEMSQANNTNGLAISLMPIDQSVPTNARTIAERISISRR